MQIKSVDEGIKAPIREYVARRAKELDLIWSKGAYTEVQR